MTHSDNHHMLQVAQGNVQELSTLFDRYNVKLYNFYLRKSNDRNLSQDLVQVVFERILRYKDTYDKNCNFRAWIYKIASNVYMDHFRKNKAKITEFTHAHESSELPKSNMDSELSERQLKLKKGLALLSDSDREILELTKMENLQIKEVASILDMTESAVKVKVHRSIKKLRQIIHG